MASRTTLALVLLALALAQAAEALAYPKNTRTTCTPTFSGLTQTIRHHNNVKLGWMAVSGNSRGVEGVKASRITKSSLPEMEWFVSSAGPALPFSRKTRAKPLPPSRATFDISAASSAHACVAPSLAGQQPFGQASCTDAHAFYISCDSCVHEEDAAYGCQIESVARDKCVQAREETGELMWRDCVVGHGANLPYQQFDISPSF